ncbi:4369_t:CDS:1, partial [Funneliformis caledonium]
LSKPMSPNFIPSDIDEVSFPSQITSNDYNSEESLDLDSILSSVSTDA